MEVFLGQCLFLASWKENVFGGNYLPTSWKENVVWKKLLAN